MNTEPSREDAGKRIDKWLWCARRFKTRSLAARFVADGGVRVTRNEVTQRIEKPGFQLRIGDRVSYLLGERLIVLSVAGFAEKRGSAEAATRIFVDRTPQA